MMKKNIVNPGRSWSLFYLLTFIVLLLHPTIAMANTGSRYIMDGYFRLCWGNLLIGLLEGLLIILIFRVPKGVAIVYMILANYVSMLMGLIWLNPVMLAQWLFGGIDEVDIYNVGRYFLLCIIICCLTSIIIEWPFFLVVLRKKKRFWLISIAAVIIAQTASYTIMVWGGRSVSDLSLIQDNTLVPAMTYPSEYPATVYYIGPEDKAVYRMSLQDMSEEKIMDANVQTKSFLRLFLEKSSDNTYWNLWGYHSHLLIENISEHPGTDWALPVHLSDKQYIKPLPLRFEDTFDLREKNKRNWRVATSKIAFRGLILQNEKAEKEFSVGLETPFFSGWYPRCPIVLPGDYVVYQLGEQIVLFDINGRRIRLLARGFGPVVVLKKKL